MEGYANLEHWVAELDKRIESILLQRLTHIIQVWCSEFDRTDDGDTRRDPLPLRDMTNKRRVGKSVREEKVSELCHTLGYPYKVSADAGRKHDRETHCARDPDTEPSHLPRPSNRVRSFDVDQTTA